jgi:hypothetical protein
MASIITKEEQERFDAAMVLINSGLVKMVYCRRSEDNVYYYCTFKLDNDAMENAARNYNGDHEDH